MVQDNGTIAEQFMQHNEMSDGSAARSFVETTNENTLRRMATENNIKGAAAQSGNLNAIVTRLLVSFPDELSAFVIAHGEVPIKGNNVRLALQAILLRAEDIAKRANAVATSDEDALQAIEDGELSAQSNNTPDNATVLSTDAQAAMKIAIDHMKDEHEKHGGDGTLTSILHDMKQHAIAAGNVVNDGASNFDLPGLATIPVDTGTINPLTGMPTITAAPAPQTNTSGIVNTGSGSGILDTITSILNGVATAAGSVTNAANAVGNASGAVHNAIGNIGSNSISTYITQNKSTIIFAVIAIAVILFLAIYAARKAK